MRFARPFAFTLTALIAAGSFAVSFVALTNLASTHGVPHSLAPVWALIVDMTIVAASVARLAMPASRFALGMLIASAAIALAGNAIHASVYGPIGIGIAAVPPAALLASVHLCVQLGVVRPQPVATADESTTPERPGWLPRAGDTIPDVASGWAGRPAATVGGEMRPMQAFDRMPQ